MCADEARASGMLREEARFDRVAPIVTPPADAPTTRTKGD